MFGAILRFYREQAGLTQDALGRRIEFSKSQVAMVERGDRPPKGQFVPRADEAVGARGALLAAAVELHVSRMPYWFEEFAYEEARCRALHSYQNQVIPGQLQTDAYARVVFGCHCPSMSDDEIEASVATRLARQKLFHRKPAAIISFIVEESALCRPLGGPAVLKEQLHHVLDIGRLRNVEIQVMPSNRQTHAGLDGPMVLLETAERQQLAYVEGQNGSFFISEQPGLGDITERYGILRAQALSPEDSAQLIEQVARGL
ncbi:helix-turn-helix domain-containing protein [Streptomyces purpurogeneiscleroticus]|uniref:helix-turn-helix domain-containing protein n=1 Tax=Streptomyces purpurogeneiscleroticus TaxID=68259 RepID=UPI001CC0C82D|nr:helix-turn-helix transcriptional regulator [Streptomyces purpurogeneiscleroticus]MBZ4017131.1 transcriptional regulator [Streptomyces purpurogeneiscleroticus]